MEKENKVTDWVAQLEKIMAELRGDQGCPWDLEQDHRSLKRYLIEETYELIDAIDADDDGQMIDELGDILLQVVFHCQIARETDRFDVQRVAQRCCEKLIRRHPHVFGDTTAADATEVLRQWEIIKKTEAANITRTSALDGVPRSLPALIQARDIQKKAAKVGFDWSSAENVFKKLEEELEELRNCVDVSDRNRIVDAIGNLLFSLVNLSRFFDISAEDVLRQATTRFYDRFRAMEAELSRTGGSVATSKIDELDTYWQRAQTGRTEHVLQTTSESPGKSLN